MARARGQGMLYRRGRTWWLKFYQDGDVVRMSSGSTNEAVARRLLKEQTARVTLKEPLVARAARVTYEELRADLITHYQATGERNLAEVGLRLKHLDGPFRGMRGSQITTPVITKYIAERQRDERPVQGRSAANRVPANGTIAREVAVLLKMLRLGFEHNKVARVPKVHMPKEAPARKGFLERPAFEAVRAHLPLDVQVIVTLLYENAWRLREVTGLHLRQVDLDRGCISLDPGQAKSTGDPRTVFLRPSTLAMLQAHVERVHALEREIGRVIPWAFPIFPGDGIPKNLVGRQRDAFERVWQRACAAAGYPGTLVHDLRRSGIRNLVRAGVSEHVAMAYSGHRSRSTFARYNITSEADLQGAAAKLDAATGSGTISGTVAPVRPLRATHSAGQSGS